MTRGTPARIRVTLRWIEVLESFDPFFKQSGEFRFVAIVTSHGDAPRVTMLPEMGFIPIGTAIDRNRVSFDQVLFEDVVDHAFTVDITGEEVDLLTRNEQLPDYRRTFTGDPATWAGRYAPGDDAPGHDPENLRVWRVCYDVEIL